jgi:hypothetical protein
VKKTLMVVVVLAVLVTAPSMFAQSSPQHTGLNPVESVVPDRRDHPTGSSEKQSKMEAGSRDSSAYSTANTNTVTSEADKGVQGVDHTTTEEVGDLATKFRKIREAREAKAKADKQAAQKLGQ